MTAHERRNSGAAPAPESEASLEEPASSVPAGAPEAPVGPVAEVEPDEIKPDEMTPEELAPSELEPDEVEPEIDAALEPEEQPATEHEPAEALSDDAHAKIEHDLEQLTARAEKADAYLELAQRTKADFENYRKRAMRDAAAAQDRGVAKLALELLPAVDNLDRALEAADAATGDGAPSEDGSSPLVDGIRLVHADVIAALARVGIEPFSPKGEQFDPQHHEAIASQPVDGAESGTVVEVYQRGYRLGDTVLRPARVVVAA
jgi:molecular chaperone GrpE